MIRLFWRLVHLLPWSVTRHVCELCDEFGTDPNVIDAALDWLERNKPEPKPVAWHCQHMSMTGAGVTSARGWCGCEMQPVYGNSTTAAA